MNEGCRVRVTGPLAGYVDGFRDELAAQGYTVQVRDRQLRLLAHVSRWMAGQGLSVAELTPDLLEDSSTRVGARAITTGCRGGR